MVRLTLPLVAASLTTVAAAQNCQNLNVPIEITALKATFNLTAPKTNIDVANFILQLTRPGANYTKELLEEEKVTTTPSCYNIQATYCEPATGPGDIAQVLTHGLAFDRSYWDVQPLNNRNYSYVEQALARGYSTFTYNRLGTGEALGSATAQNDPVNDIQAWLEVSALRALTTLVRNGGLPGVTHKYAKVVHVGHSFGSGPTFGLTVSGGNISDGIALTGFTKSTNISLYFLHSSGFVAAKTLPAFSQFPDGYVVPGTPTGLQLAFLGPGQFDPSMTERAVQLSKPVTVGELLTKGGPGAGNGAGNSAFEKPVLIITGDRDVPYCGGNCSAMNPSLVEFAGTFFPNLNSSNLETKLIPGAGHGLNFEYTALSTYATILDFFDEHIKGKA